MLAVLQSRALLKRGAMAKNYEQWPLQGAALDRMMVNISAGIQGKFDAGTEDQQVAAAYRTARHLFSAILSSPPAKNLTIQDEANYHRLERIVKLAEPEYINLDGVFKAIGSLIESNVELFSSPAEAWNNIAYAVTHPEDTWDAIQQANRQKLASILLIDNDWERAGALAKLETEQLANTAQAVLGGTGLVRYAATIRKDITVVGKQAATVVTSNVTAQSNEAGVLIKAAKPDALKDAVSGAAAVGSSSLNSASMVSANQKLIEAGAVPLKIDVMPMNSDHQQASAIVYDVMGSTLRLRAVVDDQVKVLGLMKYGVNEDASVKIFEYKIVPKWRGNGLSTRMFEAVMLEQGAAPDFIGMLQDSNSVGYQGEGLESTPWAKSLRALGYETQMEGRILKTVRSVSRNVDKANLDVGNAILVEPQSVIER